MVAKKKSVKSGSKKKINVKANSNKIDKKNFPTLNLTTERSVALDFATKVYKKFDKPIKSIILFGSTAKRSQVPGSDMDIIIVVDDVSMKWDNEVILWYREELDKILQTNPYNRPIHINTIKLSTWWEDLLVGDPVLINILRYGEALIDMAGFFEPLKYLLINGKIKTTPEAIYNALNRAPKHIMRSKISELNSIEGLYWGMVDSAHAALMAGNVSPPSPENISSDLKQHFVNSGMLKMKYVTWFRELHFLHKQISHGEIHDLKGVEIDDWQEKTQDFLETMTKLIANLVK